MLLYIAMLLVTEDGERRTFNRELETGVWERAFSEKLPENQGRNEVYFFIADPVFLPKFFIPDSKSDDNFDP